LPGAASRTANASTAARVSGTTRATQSRLPIIAHATRNFEIISPAREHRHSVARARHRDASPAAAHKIDAPQVDGDSMWKRKCHGISKYLDIATDSQFTDRRRRLPDALSRQPKRPRDGRDDAAGSA